MPQANATQKLVESEQRSKGPSHGGLGKVMEEGSHFQNQTQSKIQDTKTVSPNSSKFRLLGEMH